MGLDMFLNKKKEIIYSLITKAKLTKFSTDTETYYMPITKHFNYKWFKKYLGLKLEDKNDYGVVVEIQFDTEKIIFQGHSCVDSENYEEVFSFKLKELKVKTLKFLLEMF
jgi:hypothetical protein